MATKITKQSILDAALTVFIEKGFAGASISDIAKVAQVNQSIIYHHFESKADLWTHVKKYCAEKTMANFLPIRHDSLEHFVCDIVERRFSVYAQDHMRRLAHWQALEAEPAQFYNQYDANHELSAFNIPQAIQLLQKNKLIRSDIDYKPLAGIVFSLVSYVFYDFASAYQLSDQHIETYKKLISDHLIQLLK